MKLFCVPWGVRITHSCFAVLWPVVSSHPFWAIRSVWILQSATVLEPLVGPSRNNFYNLHRIEPNTGMPPNAPPPSPTAHQTCCEERTRVAITGSGPGGSKFYYNEDIRGGTTPNQHRVFSDRRPLAYDQQWEPPCLSGVPCKFSGGVSISTWMCGLSSIPYLLALSPGPYLPDPALGAGWVVG